jgi:hypothetical protein
MGLGKTVEILALVLANPAPPSVVSGETVKTPLGSFVNSRATLVICKVRDDPRSTSFDLARLSKWWQLHALLGSLLCPNLWMVKM